MTTTGVFPRSGDRGYDLEFHPAVTRVTAGFLFQAESDETGMISRLDNQTLNCQTRCVEPHTLDGPN